MACIQLSNMNYPTIRFIQICIPIWVCSRLEHTTYNSFLRSDHWGTPWSTGFGTAFRILPAQVGQMNAAVPISAFGVSSWFHPRCTLPSWPRLWWPMASICSQVGKLTVEGSGLPYVNIIYWYKLLVYYIYIIYMHINNEILISYMLTVNITILLPYIYIYITMSFFPGEWWCLDSVQPLLRCHVGRLLYDHGLTLCHLLHWCQALRDWKKRTVIITWNIKL